MQVMKHSTAAAHRYSLLFVNLRCNAEIRDCSYSVAKLPTDERVFSGYRKLIANVIVHGNQL